jgi:hypothetical protein
MKRGAKSLLIVAIESLVVTPIAYWIAIRWYVSSWPDFCSLILGPWSLFSSYLLVGLSLDFLVAFAAVLASIRCISWLAKRFWLDDPVVPT